MKNKKGLKPTIFPMKNRKGWMEIVEAFVAILLVAGVLLIVLNRQSIGKNDISEEVYQAQLSILREIQTDDFLREEIIDAAEPLPISWGDQRFPLEVKQKIIARTPDYLQCIGKICNMTQVCTPDETLEQDVYSQPITITSTLQAVSFRKLNLFCWTR